MRTQLETIEQIEKYLAGQLSGKELSDFERELNNSSELKKSVELQKQINSGIQRYGIKKTVQQAFKKYKIKSNLKNWGFGSALTIVTAAAISFFVLKNSTHETSEKDFDGPYALPALNENGEKNWSDADKYLPTQTFHIDPKMDTVIETKAGLILSIPANCFLNNEKPVSDGFDLEVREALDAASIIHAGLSSKSGEKLLETGGMFYINARDKDNKSLTIDPKNAIYAEVPSNDKKPGMLLFDGKRMTDGSIDWVAPKQIENYLVPQDIHSLNFYPPLYLDSLAAMGKDAKNKMFTDSLYYSFAEHFYSSPATIPPMQQKTDSSKMENSYHKVLGTDLEVNFFNAPKIFKQNCAVCHRLDDKKLTGPGLAGVFDRVPNPKYSWLFDYIKNNYKVMKRGDTYANKIFQENGGAAMTLFEGVLSDEDISGLIDYLEFGNLKKSGNALGIDPAKIKTIWNDRFQNTLLATKEFEERLAYMHTLCENNILDLYVNNLDKRMSYIDSLAAKQTGDNTFYEFAGRNDGRVKTDSKQVEKLKFYYESKSKANRMAILKTMEDFRKKQNKLDDRAEKVHAKQSEKDNTREQDNFKEEFDINLKEVYRQLGKPYMPPALIPTCSYSTPISNTGWHNVDRYVLESTTNRTTLDYTSDDGKKAVIKYEALNVNVAGAESYERITAYLIPDKLNSFMNMKETKKGFYTENLNELFKYKLIIVGYKGSNVFFYSNNLVNLKQYDNISLMQTNESSLKEELRSTYGYSESRTMLDEVNYQQFDLKDEKRHKMLLANEELSDRIGKVIFPCWHKVADDLGVEDFSKKGGKKK